MAKKYTPMELMELAIEESLRSVPEHDDRVDPKVGAIIATPDGEILASAHRGELRIGEHCEFTLIERKLKDRSLAGMVLYVTLEPCVDAARRLPKRGCASHIYKARIGKVYVGMRDPNPKVENLGVQFLIGKGVEVEEFPAQLEDKIRKINEEFVHEQEKQAMRLKETARVPVPYLEEIVGAQRLDRFQPEAVKAFLDRSNAEFAYPSVEFEAWAQDFGLVELDAEGVLRPTRLGLLFFGKDSEVFFPHAVFKVELNYGAGEPEIRDFGGPLALQMPAVLDFVRTKGLRMTIDRSGGQREEISDFPFSVLREVISNAIIHRDYEIEGATNYLYIDPHKIVVRSPGLPVAPLTVADLRRLKAPSVSRNPKIMFLFNRMGFAEQRGLGFRNMAALPGLDFGVPRVEYVADLLEVTMLREKSSHPLSTDQSENEWLDFVKGRESVAAGEFARYFQLNDKTAQRRLNELVDAGKLQKIGAKRGTRYRLPIS